MTVEHTPTARINKITLAIAFSVVVCMVGIRTSKLPLIIMMLAMDTPKDTKSLAIMRSHYEAVPPNYYYAPPPTLFGA